MLVDGNGPFFRGPGLSDETAEWFRALGRSAARKFVLALTGAVGTKLGELIIDRFTSKDEDDGEDEGRAK